MSVPVPPRAPGTRLGGNYAEMSRDWLGAYTRYARTYGDVVSYRMGPLRSVLVSDPSLIEELLVTRAAELKKSSIQQLVRPLIGDGIFLREGDAWKRRRRLVAPPFHRQHIGGYAESIVELADDLARELRDGEVRDIYREMTRLALRMVSRALFDTEVSGMLEGVETALESAASALSSRLDAALPLPNWIPTPAVLRLRAARREVDRVIDRFIAHWRATGTVGRNLLSLLVCARDTDTGLALSDEEVRDEAVTIFMAGFETTAISLAWMLWMLADAPEIARRLRAEIKDVLGGRLATADDLARLPTAENIVLEIMRLYPPAWIMGRQALSELRIGPYVVPKGWGIEFSQWVVHRDPRIWSHPDEFDPDRWANGLAARLPRFAYFPFGGGPRVCIGSALAKMEVTLVLTTLAAKVAFERLDAVTVAPDPGFTLRPASPMPLRVRRLGGAPEAASTTANPSDPQRWG